MIPWLLKIRIIENGKKKTGLILPLFILFALLLPLVLILLPFLLVSGVIFRLSGHKRPLIAVLPRIWAVITSLPGLGFRIENTGENKTVLLWMS